MIVSEADPRPPTISVVVPAYNSARTIERCMASLGNQRTEHRYEVIVVHSGVDETCALVARGLPAARILEVTGRAIPPHARNLGASVTRGQILAFLDSDAYADAEWIDNVVAAGSSGYDLVCGSVCNANPHSAVARAEQLIMFNEFLPGARKRPSWFALSGNMVLPRVAYERFGPFDEVRAAEDIVFSRRLLAAGGKVLFYPRLKIHHDNRTRLRSYLLNQVLVGRHTAIARRLVKFADSPSYALLLLLLPVAPLVKLAKIVAHLARHDRMQIRAVVREFPLVTAGVCAYCIGMVAGTLGPVRNGHRALHERSVARSSPSMDRI